jgi:soluble cytochrome b562
LREKWGYRMSHAYDAEELAREIEIGIVGAFGWAVIEFEAVLFQKFLIMSGPMSLTTEDMFRKYLMNMQAKGFVSPVDFQGKRAWKRLVIESEIEEPAMTPEEVKEFIAKAHAASKKEKKRDVSSEHRIRESKKLADSIIRTLEQVMPKKKTHKKPWEPTLIDHVEGMHKALIESKDEFLRYLKKNVPSAHDPMKKLLNLKGEEILLLSLRVIESGQRAYPPQ